MDETHEKAKAVAAEAETLAPLPEPQAALPVTAEMAPEVARRMAEIDLASTQSIITFGAVAQEEMTTLSDQMLEGVRNKDLGPAGEGLRRMVSAIRGFDASELDPDQRRSWWQRLLGQAQPLAEVIAQYDDVRGQIDKITDELLGHETVLLKDIKRLDILYEKTLAFYDEIGLYIAAGEAKLKEIDEQTIPAKEAEVTAAPEGDGVMAAQELRDLRAARDELERRVHDMKLTRQVTLQSLPSIRLVQENDKSLVSKINSTLVNTVPLWKSQLVQAVTIFRARKAAGAVKEASDLTNELLAKNAEQLQTANREVRTQMERGIFDIQTIKEANATLIATIEESLEIADEGKAKRAEAEGELQKMEGELRSALSASRARAAGVTPDAAGDIDGDGDGDGGDA